MSSAVLRVRFLIVGIPLLLIACSDGPSGPSPGEDDGNPIPGPEPIPEEIVNWLKVNAHPFDTPEPGNGLEDLQFLKEMVGEARVVSLGEATHGTREFFQMKHRVLEFLVEEMDFNLFAIEANWAEAYRLNEYVHTGNGDPSVLLAGLYFWTWNTQEVLDMIEWMRAHNQDPGDSPTVSFLGFDMQYPGMPIHNVLEFLSTVDPPAVQEVSALYDCMSRYANSPRGFNIGHPRYRSQPQAYRDDCLANLLAAQEFLLARRGEYEAASSPEELSKIERGARIVIQYEDSQSGRTRGARDLFMAENAVWLHDQAGPESKMVLWAHNGHVADNPDYGYGASMGWHLRRHYSDEMVIVGFDFYEGGFRAIMRRPDGNLWQLFDLEVGRPVRGSYEYFFHSAGLERMVLDLRSVDLDTPATSWLKGPRRMRIIGSIYTPSDPGSYQVPVSIADRFDLIIYFDNTVAAFGLPDDPPYNW